MTYSYTYEIYTKKNLKNRYSHFEIVRSQTRYFYIYVTLIHNKVFNLYILSQMLRSISKEIKSTDYIIQICWTLSYRIL